MDRTPSTPRTTTRLIQRFGLRSGRSITLTAVVGLLVVGCIGLGLALRARLPGAARYTSGRLRRLHPRHPGVQDRLSHAAGRPDPRLSPLADALTTAVDPHRRRRAARRSAKRARRRSAARRSWPS